MSRLGEQRRHGMHSLRHTLATRLLEDGTPVEQIADILGHRSVASTGVYLKSSLRLLAQPAPWTRTRGVGGGDDERRRHAVRGDHGAGGREACRRLQVRRRGSGCWPGSRRSAAASSPGWTRSPRRRCRRGSPRRAGGASSRRPCRDWPRRSGSWPAGWAGEGVPAYLLPRARCPGPPGTSRTSTPTGTGGAVHPDRPLPLLLGGSAAAPGHAGAVPHDLRLRAALLGGPAAARRSTSTSTPGCCRSATRKAARTGRCPSPSRCANRLADYHTQVAGQPGRREWFFPGSRPGEPLTLGNVDHNFRRFLWQARISHGGPGHGPRVHDLRHTLAVNNLRSWFAQRA